MTADVDVVVAHLSVVDSHVQHASYESSPRSSCHAIRRSNSINAIGHTGIQLRSKNLLNVCMVVRTYYPFISNIGIRFDFGRRTQP